MTAPRTPHKTFYAEKHDDAWFIMYQPAPYQGSAFTPVKLFRYNLETVSDATKEHACRTLAETLDKHAPKPRPGKPKQ